MDYMDYKLKTLEEAYVELYILPVVLDTFSKDIETRDKLEKYYLGRMEKWVLLSWIQ